MGEYARVRLDEMAPRAAKPVGELRAARRPERVAMGDLLSLWPWRIYCTWTFGDRIGEEGACREIERWLRLLEFAYGQHVGWVYGLEQEPGHPWPHAHGLICGPVEGVRTMYKGKPHQRTVPLIEPYFCAWWDRHGTGEFRVVDGRGARAPAFYCSKYATKRGQLYFSANLSRFRGTAVVLERFELLPPSV